MNTRAQDFDWAMEIVQERLQDLTILVNDIRSASESGEGDAPASLDHTGLSRVVRPIPIGPKPILPVPGSCADVWPELGEAVMTTDAAARLELALRNCADVVGAANLRMAEAEG